MDKVIIDGVDVSGCEHYRAEIETKMPYGEYEIQKDKCHYSGIEIIQDCKGIKGCIYKQLKRLQQENEQLKKSIDRIMQDKEIKTIDSEIALLNAELEQENEELKGKYNGLNANYNSLKFENERLKENDCEQCKHLDLYIKYKQTLQEIKGIAEDRTKTEDYLLGQEYTDLVDKILAKINEVIGAE